VDEIKKGIEFVSQELYNFGVKIHIKLLYDLEAEQELNMINSLLEQGVNAIAMVPIEHPSIKDRINTLFDEGIPVVTFNSDIQESKRLCFIGQNHLVGGRVAGGIMGRIVKSKDQVAVITSSYNLLCHINRVKGFNSVLEEEYQGVQIIEVLENEDREDKAFEQTMSLLNKYSNLGGIYVTGGGVSGVGKALKVLGMEGKVKVVCHDFVKGTVDLLRERVVDFTIGQDPFKQGYLPVKILYDYLTNNKEPESEFLWTQIDIRTKDNIDFNSMM
jgi:LacI family transcriptional regulator